MGSSFLSLGVSDPGFRSPAKLPLNLLFLSAYQTEPGSEAAQVQVRTKDPLLPSY